MKTGNTYHIKNRYKLISAFLSAAMAMQVGLSLQRTRTDAATNTFGEIEVSGSEVTLSCTGGRENVDFTITEGDSGGYKITCDSPNSEDDAEKEVSSITKLTVSITGYCHINADMEAGLVLESQYGYVEIGSGYEFNCTGLTAFPSGVLDIYGTFIMDDFISAAYASSDSTLLITNAGVISAHNVDITDDAYLRHSSASVYEVSDSFVKGEDDLEGKVVATSPTATITSAGGSFVLEYDGRSMTLEGDIDTTVADLFLTPTSAEFDFPADEPMTTFIYGVDYSFDDYISITPSGYTGEAYVEYADQSGDPEFSTTIPDYPGSYYARIVVPVDGDYAGSLSPYHSYKIEFLDLDNALFPGTSDQYVSFDNVVRDHYVNDVLLVSAAPGYEISCTHVDGGAFESQLEIYENDIFDGDSLNLNAEFAFRDQTYHQTTRRVPLSTICPEIADIVFDVFEPEINLDSADGVEAPLEDGGSINAEEVVFSVWDDTLKEIYINGTLTYDEDDFVEEGYQELTFTSTEGVGTEYVIRAVDEFDQESTFEFTLYPLPVDPTLEVSLPDEIFVGQDYDVSVETNSDGLVSIQYYYTDRDTLIEGKPTTVGSYICSVYVPATDLYNAAGQTVGFEIKRNIGTATVTVPQPLYVGDEYEPDVDTDSNGDVTFIYRENVDGMPLSTTPPTAAGNYTVMASIAQTAAYEAINTSFDFSIFKRDATATISVPDSLFGENYAPTYSTTSDGASSAVIEYKVQGADDRTYTTTQPTAAGTYTARYTVPETDTYLGVFATDDFTIGKKTATASVSVPDTVYGDPYSPALTTDSDGAARAVYEYKPANASDDAYTTTAPTVAGTYTLRVTIPETDTYKAVSATDSFTISRRTPSLNVSISDPFAGITYSPSVTTDSDGASSAVIEYKEKNAPDTTYSTTQPTAYGNYTVRVTLPETPGYEGIIRTADYNVVYLPAPENAYDLAGTKGDNDYFTSDVEITAPEGYTISSSLTGTYGASIPYSEDLNSIYLKRTEDGALTSAIAIARPQIDKEEPVITDTAGSLVNGSVVYSGNYIVTASDDNLLSLTINGEEVDISNGSTVVLSPGNGIAVFRIVAVDKAGHISILEFTLMAEWLKDRIIPADLIVPLQSGEQYILGEGHWKVLGSGGEDDSDPTVYNSGVPVFVRSDGDFVFTSVDAN
ncbi:MAG: hypothetical protein J6Z43_08035 [Clostridiales bacterium]|nr:hypothetical protein [Clostridiales bacterium]